MSFLASILRDQHESGNPFVLVQSSVAQSALPILRAFINAQTNHSVILLCILYLPSSLLSDQQSSTTTAAIPLDVQLFDWTADIPGYTYEDEPRSVWSKRIAQVVRAIEGSEPSLSLLELAYDLTQESVESSTAVTVVVDSLDTLADDLESASAAYRLLSRIERVLCARKDASRLICHLTALSPLLPMLQAPSFSPSLTRITAYPPALILHIASAYFALPPSSPPHSPDGEPSPDDFKFWRVFIPLADRPRAIERLVFGSDADPKGSSSSSRSYANGGVIDRSSTFFSDQFVVEVLVRTRRTDTLPPMPAHTVRSNTGSGSSGGSGESTKRRRGTERVLLGWKRGSTCSASGRQSSGAGNPVELESLDDIRPMWQKRFATAAASTAASPELAHHDPMKDFPFKLSLTEQQRASRFQVPLPYEHTGTTKHTGSSQAGQILYEPDSADDLDEEDPDEDLDI